MQFSISRRTSRGSGICLGRAPTGLAALLCALSILAICGERATAQAPGGFNSHYGSDATNAAHSRGSYSYNSSQKDPPYQSHFGASRPAGHRAITPPSSYQFGMDADSLYAAGAAQAGYHQSLAAQQQQYAAQMAAAQQFAPYVYYVVPDHSLPQPMAAGRSPDGIGTLASLAPGVEWQTDFANFQEGSQEDVPALPPAEGSGAADGQEQVFGQQQERIVAQIEEMPLQFLRAQSVLLEPGERQIDIGMVYAIADGLSLNVLADASPPAGDDVLLTIRARQRLLMVPITIRYGWSENVQLFYNIPFGWSNAELAIPGSFDEWSNRTGIGDVTCGATVLLYEGCGDGPNVLGTFAFTAPTGDADFFITGGVPNSRLGEGFWATSAQLLVTHTMDPCVLYYGLGYRHRFDDNFRLGVRANPGEQFIYQLGVGFAANESVTFATGFVGAYVTEDHINGQRVEGGITEPMRVRFSATIAKPCNIVEPYVEIGTTRDAADTNFGIIWTY